MKSKKLLALLFLTASVTATSQVKLVDSIDTFITNTLSKFPEIPGLAISIVKDGKAMFSKAYGYSDVASKTKATIETPYYIASITKSFVGLLAIQLSEEGKLDLEKPITGYAPIKNFKDKSVFEGVTIKDLLSHTSGIMNGPLTRQFASIGEYTRESMISILENKTKLLQNNKSLRYDNLGYNVLDLILSEEFSINWKNALQDKVFTPLEMSHTSAYLSDGKKKHWNVAKTYIGINDKRLPELAAIQKNDATFQAAGGMIVSIKDAQNWLLVNINKGKLNGKQVFSENIIKKAHSQVAKGRVSNNVFKDSGYGIGWINATYKERDAVYHFGGFDGAFSHVSLLPKEKIGVAVFTNESHFGDNVSNLIAEFVYDLLLEEDISMNDYSEKVEKVTDRVNRIQKSFRDDRVKRASRKWTLTQPTNKYLGVYQHEFMGTINIEEKKGELIASLGIAKIAATPSNTDDSIRVEFRNAQGRDILFVVDRSKKVVAAIYGGTVYLKK